MNKTLLFFFLVVSVSGLSQTNFRFADSTAQWNVLETWQGMCWCYTWETHILKVQGDTTMNSENYQIIGCGNACAEPLNVAGNIYLRQDSTKSVFCKLNADSAEFLLYDFGKQAGDSFEIVIPHGWYSPLKVHVDSVSSVFWGRNRKTLFVTIQAIDTLSDVFVEGIGSLYSFLLYPGVEYSFFDGPDYGLLCYFEDDTVVYHSPDLSTCQLDSVWIGMEELQPFGVSFSPNPVTSHLTIQLQQTPSSTATFQLFDLTGRMILQKQLTEKETLIELSGVSKGMYLYEVSSAEQQIASGKLVVE